MMRILETSSYRKIKKENHRGTEIRRKWAVREGEAPAEPLTVYGSPGGSSSHALIKA
jgi:hypothetical protein